VRRVERKLRWYRLQEKLLMMKRRAIIVVSHAPVLNVHDLPDRCHTGFRCFRDFIRRTSPLLWLHGHVHLPDPDRSQVSRVDATTVVNVCGCKVISIGASGIAVSPRCDASPGAGGS
jgi:Icc-related predicted phosphoesterase